MKWIPVLITEETEFEWQWLGQGYHSHWLSPRATPKHTWGLPSPATVIVGHQLRKPL